MSAVSLPNVLTYLRILAVPAVVLCLFLIDGNAARWWALAVYIAACITDWLDGYLARVWEQQSTLGRMLDPIADKLLVGATLMMLVYDNTIRLAHIGRRSSSCAARSWSRACASSWPSSTSGCTSRSSPSGRRRCR